MPRTDAEIMEWWKKCGLSVTTPITQKDYICAWSHEPNQHTIPKGHVHVRVVYEDTEGDMQTDRICVECWTTK